jgi:uncharacterized protein (TIGR02145 family)
MDKMVKKCKESEGCLAKLGREVNADYVCQARIGRFGKDLTIKAELYESKNGDLISSFTGTSKNIYGLLTILDKEAPEMFKRIEDKMPTPTFQPKPVKEIPSIPAPPPTPQKSKETAPSTPIYGNTLHDSRDGKTYRVVKIGSQTWMAQNLDYHGEDGYLGLCYGDKPQDKIRNPENCKKYGRLYDFDESIKACPKGWHLPKPEEWETLVNFAGGGEVAGKKLKSKNGWKETKCKWTELDERGRTIEYDKCTTDEYGFSALPGGYWSSGFNHIGEYGHWWSYAYTWSIGENTHWYSNNQYGMFSVRCVRD